jgi:bifunctional non-homologous end joining protein LigD
LKLDGFRAHAHFENGKAELVSRNGNTFASFRNLAAAIAPKFKAETGVLDGELVSLDANGYPQFENLLFRKGELFFVAFDALYLNGEDLRGLPLIERKARLRDVVPTRQSKSRLRYHTHVERHGKALFQLTCERNLEGIVCKRRDSPYDTRRPLWVKVKNQNYSQAEGRVELFEELRS